MTATLRGASKGALIFLTLFAASGGRAADDTVRFAIQEERLGAMGEFATSLPSPDGNHVAEWKFTGPQQSVVIADGRPDAEFGRIVAGAPTIFFSPDSSRRAYRVAQGARQRMVVDGRPDPDDDEVGRPVFSPDGRRCAYAARNGERHFVVLDGTPQPEHESRVSDPTFSPDSAHFAYVAVDYKTAPDGRPLGAGDRLMPGNSTARMILDGVAGPAFDDFCTEPVFSPDSRHLAYTGRLPRTVMQALVVDGNILSSHPSILKIVFSPDSQRVALWAGRENGKAYVVCDGRSGPEYDDIPGAPVFSADSRHVAYRFGRAGRQGVVLDGTPGPEFDQVEGGAWLDGQMRGLLFSPDSRWLAYVAARGGKQRVVVAGREGPDVERVEALRFSPDSRRVAYLAVRDGKQRVFADGLPGPEFDDIEPLSLRFSPDSKRLAYAAKNGRKAVAVTDGQVSPEYEGSPLFTMWIVFSPDSRHTAYLACRGGRTCLVQDGQPGAEFDGALDGGPWFHPLTQDAMAFMRKDGKCALVLAGGLGPLCDRILKYEYADRVNPAGPTVRPDGTVEYLAVKDGALVRIRHVPVKP